MSDLYEKMDIQTPEQISLEFSLAGLGSRALALLYDSLVQALAAVLILVIVAYYGRSLQQYWVRASNWMTAVVIFLFFCMYWGYFAVFEILWNGQTPGKRHAQIRVISRSGRPITVFEGVARNLLRAIDSFGFYAVAVVAGALDKENRRLGDMVAGTVVVHVTRGVADTKWYASAAVGGQSLGDLAGSVTPAEFKLIETFLARRLELPAEVRRRQGEAIAQRIADRLNVSGETRLGNEELLEEIARSYRDGGRYR
jgi:uncharacterized RDD family membrane protein YckC